MNNPWPLVRSVLSRGGANGWAQAENGIAGRRQRSAASHRAADGRHRGCYGIRERVNGTAADSAEREKTSRGELQLAGVPYRHAVEAGGVPEGAQGRGPRRGQAEGGAVRRGAGEQSGVVAGTRDGGQLPSATGAAGEAPRM